MSEQEPQAPPFPKVSAVIVSRNCAEPLRRCLAALRNAHFRDNIEVIVVDAGSRDGSGQLDKEFDGVTALRLPQNFGKTRARNIGIRTATGEFLLFLEPQVELARDAIEKLAQTLVDHPEVGAAAPVLLNASGTPLPNAYRLPGTEDLKSACRERRSLPRTVATGQVEAVAAEAFLIRKSFIAGMRYLDEKRFAQHWAELDVFRQLKNAGKQVIVLDTAKATVHGGGSEAEDETLEAADRVLGAAGFLAKTQGFGVGLSFRVSMTLGSLSKFSLFYALLTGRRIDGMLK